MHAFSKLIKFISAVMAMSYCTLYRISAHLHVGSTSAEKVGQKEVGGVTCSVLCRWWLPSRGCPWMFCSSSNLWGTNNFGCCSVKSFVAYCLVGEGSDLFRMGGASGRECQSLWFINRLHNRWFQSLLTQMSTHPGANFAVFENHTLKSYAYLS